MHVACLAQKNKPTFSVSVFDRMDNITGDGQVEGQQAVPTTQIVKIVQWGTWKAQMQQPPGRCHHCDRHCQYTEHPATIRISRMNFTGVEQGPHLSMLSEEELRLILTKDAMTPTCFASDRFDV